MKVELKTVITLTEDEAKAIEKARDILCDYEYNSRGEQDTALVNWFESEMEYCGNNYSALPVSIDFLTFLLRVSGYEDED